MFVDKRGQYATDDDVLKNFKQTAAMNHETPERSLWGFVSKHLIALKNMIDQDMKNTGAVFNYQAYEDKALDVYNYMALLLAIVRERENTPRKFDAGDALWIDNTQWTVMSSTSSPAPHVTISENKQPQPNSDFMFRRCCSDGYPEGHTFADDTPTKE